MEINDKILNALPYGKDFRFVDSIESVDEDQIKGSYTFRKDLPFYDSHFRDKPLVPGVIMIETMGQIGMVCHLVFLTCDYEFKFLPVLSNVEASFFGNADYGETCYVTGKKIYFRKNILKSSVEMRKADGSLIATLTANIMIIKNNE
jgi:3-hydroxyacyl-[acyl-carrier-protein] dehydratase